MSLLLRNNALEKSIRNFSWSHSNSLEELDLTVAKS